MKLKGKVAIVTGGARGIGAGIARCLSEEGATVAILDLDGPEAERTASGLGSGSLGLRADIAEETDGRAAVAEVARRLGGLDILVNNAGGGRDIGRPQPQEAAATPQGIEGHTQERWDEQLATNLRTTFIGTKAAVPYLRERGGGSIVNIASIAGLLPSNSITAYAAAKAGVISLTRSTALEYAAHDIRVNAICPGFLWTRAWEGLARGMQARVPGFAGLDPRDVFLHVVAQGVPLGREQTPEDIGRLAAFLCSEEARNITGQFISVDGGITLRSASA